jgi:Fe2+ transport system protein FeoA
MENKIINEMFSNPKDLKYLSELKPGQNGIVYRIENETVKNLLRLYDLGFVPGHEVKMIRKAPLNGPLEVKLLNCHLSIRDQHAKNILLEQVPKKDQNKQFNKYSKFLTKIIDKIKF